MKLFRPNGRAREQFSIRGVEEAIFRAVKVGGKLDEQVDRRLFGSCPQSLKRRELLRNRQVSERRVFSLDRFVPGGGDSLRDNSSQVGAQRVAFDRESRKGSVDSRFFETSKHEQGRPAGQIARTELISNAQSREGFATRVFNFFRHSVSRLGQFAPRSRQPFLCKNVPPTPKIESACFVHGPRFENAFQGLF